MCRHHLDPSGGHTFDATGVVPEGRGGRALRAPRGGQVALLELRDDRSPTTSNVLAYGASEAFALEGGQAGVVPVGIPMRAVPRVTSVTLVGPTGVPTSTPQVRLRLEIDRGDLSEVVGAQDASFSLGCAEMSIEAGTVQTVDYDLDLGCAALARAPMARAPCSYACSTTPGTARRWPPWWCS